MLVTYIERIAPRHQFPVSVAKAQRVAGRVGEPSSSPVPTLIQSSLMMRHPTKPVEIAELARLAFDTVASPDAAGAANADVANASMTPTVGERTAAGRRAPATPVDVTLLLPAVL